METPDLDVAGPGSPVSLKKFLAYYPAESDRQVRALITDGVGLAMDDPTVACFTHQACNTQADFFREEVFLARGKRMPPYLMRHLLEFFTSSRFKTVAQLLEAIAQGTLTAEHPDFMTVQNLVEYSAHNPEGRYLIGFLTLLEGSLALERKSGTRVPYYIEYPEAFLHPKRTSKFMYVLDEILKAHRLTPPPEPDL